MNNLCRAVALILLSVSPSVAQSVDFGDDSYQYANDGECDDPRFVGEGMSLSVSNESIKADATDCSGLFGTGKIRLAREKSQSNISECATIDYGNDGSQWAGDSECDDPRFTGGSTDEIMLQEDLMRDASDCKALCEQGLIWLK